MTDVNFNTDGSIRKEAIPSDILGDKSDPKEEGQFPPALEEFLRKVKVASLVAGDSAKIKELNDEWAVLKETLSNDPQQDWRGQGEVLIRKILPFE